MYELAGFGLLVPLDCRLPNGWKIRVGGYAMPPLLVGINLKNSIQRRRDKLSEEDCNDPNFVDDSELWPSLLSDERLAAIEATGWSPPPPPPPPCWPPSANASRLLDAESFFCADGDKSGIVIVLKVGDLTLRLLWGCKFPHSGRACGGEGGG
jgi:hypothetical protein